MATGNLQKLVLFAYNDREQTSVRSDLGVDLMPETYLLGSPDLLFGFPKFLEFSSFWVPQNFAKNFLHFGPQKFGKNIVSIEFPTLLAFSSF